MAIYESKGKQSDTLSQYSLHLTEQHLYGSSRLGIVNRVLDLRKDSSTTSLIRKFVRGNKRYELSNHLGNVLATISDKKLGESRGSDTVLYYRAEVINAQDYYPFGMIMPGRGGRATRASFSADETGTRVVEASPEYSAPRTAGSPSVYLGLNMIVFEPGFTTPPGDHFTTLVGDSARTYSGGGTLESSNAWVASSDGSYRYGFNGKENDNDVKGIEGSQQDYGMRIYDPRVGRFLSVDPLSGEYPWNSTYAFAENDVIRSIDVDGAEKHVQTFAYSVSNGETVAKVISNDYKQPAGTSNVYTMLGGKPTTTEETVAQGFVSANKLPAGGTFSFSFLTRD